jgi:hypothetical protein
MEASIISCSKEIQDATVGRKFDVCRLLGLLSGTWNNCHKCNVLWHALERTETCNPLYKKRKTVEGNFVVARQRPPPHCRPHIGNPQTEVGGHGTPSLQSGSSTAWFPPFLTAQRSFKQKKIFGWWWCESNGASVTTRSTKNIFFMALKCW